MRRPAIPRAPVARRARAGLALALLAGALGACDVPSGVPPIDRPDTSVTVDDPSVTVVIVSPADIATLAGVKHLGGDLEIRSTSAIELPDLVEVGGSIRIVGTATAKVTSNVTFPALTRVGGTLSATYGKGSGTLIAPKLTVIGTHLSLTHGSWNLQFDALETLGGDLRLQDAELSGAFFSALKTVGGSLRFIRFSVAGAASLALEFPELESIEGELAFSYGPTVQLSLPKLRTISSDLKLDYLTIALDAGQLGDIGGDLRIENSTVDALDIPILETVHGDIVLDGAHGPGLDTLEFQVLKTVAGGVRVNEVANIQSLLFDSLIDLGGKLSVNATPALTLVSLNLLTKAKSAVLVRQAGDVIVELNRMITIDGDFRIEDCGTVQLRAPLLTTVGGTFSMRGGTLGARPGVQALSRVGHDLFFANLTCRENSLTLDAITSVGGAVTVDAMLYLERIVMPSLVTIGSSLDGVATGGLLVQSNWNLIDIAIPSLSRIQLDAIVRGNLALPAAAATGFLNGVQVGGTTVVCGNAEDAPCP